MPPLAKIAPRKALEQAVLAYLEPLSQRQGRYLRELGTYNGELDTEEGTAALMNRLLGAQPAVLVSTGTAKYQRRGSSGLVYLTAYEVVLLVCSGHLRSREAQREGDEAAVYDAGADPGIWTMLDDCVEYLAGRAGPGDAKDFDPQRESPVITLPNFTLWQLVFEIGWTREVPSETDRQAAGKYTEIVHKHDQVDGDPNPPNPIVEGLQS